MCMYKYMLEMEHFVFQLDILVNTNTNVIVNNRNDYHNINNDD